MIQHAALSLLTILMVLPSNQAAGETPAQSSSLSHEGNAIRFKPKPEDLADLVRD